MSEWKVEIAKPHEDASATSAKHTTESGKKAAKMPPIRETKHMIFRRDFGTAAVLGVLEKHFQPLRVQVPGNWFVGG